MKRRSTPAAVVAAVSVTALATAGLLALPAHAAGVAHHVVPDITPAWATHAADRGSMAAGATVAGRVYLASRDAAGLHAFAAAVSTPGNPLYHHYLSAAAVRDRFGSRPGSGAAVAHWLRSSGLHVTGVNGHYVGYRGPAATVGHTFGVSLHRFAANGRVVHAPVGQVTVPAVIGRNILTVTGLSSDLVVNRPMLTSDTNRVTSRAGKAFPCSDYEAQKKAKPYPKAYGKTQPYAVCGYQPAQLRGAYGVTKSGFTGKGISMVVVDAYALPTMQKDLKTWISNRGEQPLKKGQYKEYVPAGTPYNPGWAGEEALDVEAIKAMAPDANIRYVAAKTAGDSSFLTAFQTIIDKHLGDAVNNSWEGGTDAQTSPSTITAFENLFQMGAAEGIGFYFSSGDGGGGGTLYPSVDPYVTSVGGSAVGIDSTNSYMWETSWETDYSALSSDGMSWTPAPPGNFTSGAGGGTSVVFKQPKWQKGVVPKKFSEQNGATPMRTSPDIGAEADPTTGFLEGYSSQSGGSYVYGELRIGGTSLSSPLIVGMQADAEQAAGGTAIGFANPSIYARYGTNSYHDVTDNPFGDGTRIAHVRMATLGGVTTVALATAGNAKDAQLASVKGYDTTTGVGTPTASYFSSFASTP